MRLRSDQSQRAGRRATVVAIVTATILVTFSVPSLASRGKPEPVPMPSPSITEGSLMVLDKEGQPQNLCPLQHTNVAVEISGFLARATVTQQFHNPFDEKIEAVYTFPLPQRAAVDDMTLTVGDREVRGKIKHREEAQAIYEAARVKGQVAGLLDQERPNIFTQSVANIMPGEQVTVTISYVEMLQYQDGSYEFVYPMVVGPRYIPGEVIGKVGAGWSLDTDQVPDASRITPRVPPPGNRAGHDISLTVSLDAGVPVASVSSTTHAITTELPAPSRAAVSLTNKATIPNKDFILKYDVAGGKIEDAVLTHRTGKDGFVTLILQPPNRVKAEEVTPKELVFVLDTSGSMSGFPIEKAKETMKLALDGLYPQDTFNLITFAGQTRVLFPEPVPATKENLRLAQEFLKSRRGSGGTEMMRAIRTALEPSASQKHVRIVCFMTDGYVGNDMAIIGEVQKHPNARVFSFGIGNSVNRFLLDKMAEHGRGEVEYVGLKDDGSAAARRFHERIRNPLLTDISVDWGDLQVQDVYPKQIPDLFAAKPLMITGRYSKPGASVIRLHGLVAGLGVTREITVTLPNEEKQHDVLATLWARTKIADLMGQDFTGMQRGTTRSDVREAITELGLTYRLMTQFTSFIAVEEMTITEGGEPRRIDVPVEMPDGVSYEGVFGNEAPAGGYWTPKNGPVRAFTSADAISLSISGGASQAPGRSYRFQKHARPHQKSSQDSASRRQFEALQEKPKQPAGEREEATVRAPASEPSAVLAGKKLSHSLAALVERLKITGSSHSAEEAKFVKDGKAEIQVWLTDSSEDTLAALKKVGFELLLKPTTGNRVIGRIPIEKLAALAELKGVRYVLPLITNA